MKKIFLWLLSFEQDLDLLLGGLLSVVWGLWLMSPFWNTYNAAFFFAAFAALGPPWIFGGAAVLLGTAKIYSTIRQVQPLLRCTAFALVMQWITVSILVFLGDPTNTAMVVYPFLATWNAWLWLRIKMGVHLFSDRRLVRQIDKVLDAYHQKYTE
jgi:hypothetical protein